MKLNTTVEIKCKFDPKTQTNDLSIEFNKSHTPGEIFTTLEMAKQGIEKMLKKHIAENFENGKCTKEEFDIIYKTPIEKLNNNRI